MNLYLIVFLLLAVDALAEIRQPKLERWLYPVCWGFVTMLLVFRFGQGTDYVTYHAIYETIRPATSADTIRRLDGAFCQPVLNFCRYLSGDFVWCWGQRICC